jgi:hypothetical protein
LPLAIFRDIQRLRRIRAVCENWIYLRGVVLPIPERPQSGSLKPIPFDAPITNSNVIAFDNHLVNPYIQNFNLELQRQLANNLTLELRYIGTKGTKLFPATGFSLNINPANAIENGILEAFKVTQAGGDAALFNQMLNGITLTGVGTVNGTSLTGSAALQQFSGTRTFLANGDPSGLANYLARTAPAGGKVGDYVRRNGFPENFILTNPQVGTNQALLWTNAANSTYQSFNVAITKRLSHGFTNKAPTVGVRRSVPASSIRGNAATRRCSRFTARTISAATAHTNSPSGRTVCC